MSIVTEIDVMIGARIRARREAIGMTQVTLSDQLGVTFQQVQKYERGVNRVSADTLLKAAEAMRCTAAELLGESTAVSNGDGKLGDLYRTWVSLSAEQQGAVVALMKTMG